MHDLIFYIFAAIVLFSVMHIAFIANVKSSIKSFLYFVAGISGLLLITNSQLLSILICLLLLIVFFTAYMLKENVNKYLIVENGSPLNTSFISMLAICLLTAIFASLFGNTRWQMMNIDNAVNSYSLLFTGYLPVVILTGIFTSVMIASMVRIVKYQDTKS